MNMKAKNCKPCEKAREKKARIDENAKLLRGDNKKLQVEPLSTSDNKAINQ